jgi:hypothetical protein
MRARSALRDRDTNACPRGYLLRDSLENVFGREGEDVVRLRRHVPAPQAWALHLNHRCSFWDGAPFNHELRQHVLGHFVLAIHKDCIQPTEINARASPPARAPLPWR